MLEFNATKQSTNMSYRLSATYNQTKDKIKMVLEAVTRNNCTTTMGIKEEASAEYCQSLQIGFCSMHPWPS